MQMKPSIWTRKCGRNREPMTTYSEGANCADLERATQNFSMHAGSKNSHIAQSTFYVEVTTTYR